MSVLTVKFESWRPFRWPVLSRSARRFPTTCSFYDGSERISCTCSFCTAGDRNTDPSIRQARKAKVLVEVPTPPPRFFRNDIIPKDFRPINVQGYHSKEVRSAATRANKQEAMTVAERQFGANLKLGATFGSAKFEHVLFYPTST